MAPHFEHDQTILDKSSYLLWVLTLNLTRTSIFYSVVYSTHPSKHFHFCYAQFLDIMFLNRPTLRLVEHSGSYSRPIGISYNYSRYSSIALYSRGISPF